MNLKTKFTEEVAFEEKSYQHAIHVCDKILVQFSDTERYSFISCFYFKDRNF